MIPRRIGLHVIGTWTPPGSDGEVSLSGGIGPLLEEETDYVLYAHSVAGRPVQMRHRDPVLLADVHESKDRTTAYGNVNFRSQVGRSRFSVFVDNEAELDFEVEVFPSKLDYATDYPAILADIQDVMTGLALEYLSATTQLGAAIRVPLATDVEWLTTLRSVADKLERSLRYIEERPVRRFRRDLADTRIHRLKGADPRVRQSIRRGAGSGAFKFLANGKAVHDVVPAGPIVPTLDTPEHRWLANQLRTIRRRLLTLLSVLDASVDTRHGVAQSARTQQARGEIGALLSRITRLALITPIRAAEGLPPPGFSSLQLMGAPGYRDAFEAATALALGLHVGGGPLELSVKDLSTLYEYWCYLALLRMIRAELGAPTNLRELVRLEGGSLRVLLKKGWQTNATFERGARKVSLIYNPGFVDRLETLVAQQPDIVVAIEDEGWPRLMLVLDAKYRVNTEPDYKKTYGAPGPPADALNALHRYRDAILERELVESPPQLKRMVVQGAALYPYVEETIDSFRDTRLWKSLERIGIGAIPMLPGHLKYAEAWLRTALGHGGWTLADLAIPHASSDRAHDWRSAARQTVMIANHTAPGYRLREYEGMYELEMPLLTGHPDQLNSQWIALPENGRFTVYAVTEVLVEDRAVESSVAVVRYKLQPAALSPQVTPLQPLLDGLPVWTTRLALERATTSVELDLRTEAEWRLLEELRALGFEVHLAQSADGRHEAPWIVTPDRTRARYAGALGFAVRQPDGTEVFVRGIEDVLDRIPATL